MKIKYKGISSDQFYLFFEEMLFTSPRRNLETVKILGRDGEIKTGDGTLNNVQVSFPFTINAPFETELHSTYNNLNDWLKGDNEWHALEFDKDPNYQYQAMCLDEYNLSQVLHNFGKGTLDFELKPYKFLKSGLNEVVLGSSITNPLNRPSKPKLTLKGTGNITLKIGASELTLKNVDGGIVIDSLYQTVTNLAGTALAWDKVTSYPLPTIAPGRQSVTTTGNVTEIKIIPRWEAIV